MPNQILQIEPQNELKFKVDSSGRFEHGHTTYMRLINPTNDTVLFKIKTTAPKKYCVRPNSGSLEPNGKVEIAITPQPVLVDANEKHKHKFMVQSAVAPEGKTNIDQVWREIGTNQLMDYKLKCVFDAPRGSNLNDSGDNAIQNEIAKKNVLSDESKSKILFSYSDNAESDLQRATSEVLLLREEESKLRHENLQLKEQLLRFRQGGGDRRDIRSHTFEPQKNAQILPLPWVITAIGMAMLGILIGKFFM